MALTLITAATSEPLTIAEARRQLQFNSSAGEPAPTAPTVALISPAAAGDCDNGDWRIGFTFVTADGETGLGDLSAIVTVANKTVNGKIACTNVAIGGTLVTARNCYAIPPGGSNALKVGQIANNTATTYTVNIASGSLGVQAPTVNTTADPELTRLITAVRERGELATGRAFMTQTWDWQFDIFPWDAIWLELPKPPLVSVTSITYLDTAGDTQTWAASNYVVQPYAGPRCRNGRVALGYQKTWPVTLAQAGAVTVRFVAGYASAAAVPQLLKSAMLLDLSTLYAERENLVKGISVNELPNGVRDIYRQSRAHMRQRVAA